MQKVRFPTLKEGYISTKQVSANHRWMGLKPIVFEVEGCVENVGYALPLEKYRSICANQRLIKFKIKRQVEKWSFPFPGEGSS